MGPTSRGPTPRIPGVEITGVVGSGGSGVVYLGRQGAFGRDVAVKVANRGSAPDDAIRRWEREVAAIGRLSNHPNIVPVFDAGITEDGWPYLVMPHVPGGSLTDRLREGGPMPPDQVAVVGAKLAGALDVVHAAGILHRDVKPDNVLWSPHGEPQLTDFGIARLQDLTTTSGGEVRATIAYAAPEVLAGEPATAAADLYGLGATLHACLTGTSPYPSNGDNLGVLVARVLEEPPPSLRAAGVPAALAEVIERAMAREPSRRPASAAAMREALVAADTAATDPGPTAAHTAVLPPAPPPPEPPPTAPQPVVAPRPAASSPPPDRDRSDRRPGGLLWVAVAAVLVLFLGLVAYGLARDDGGGTAAGDTSTTTEALPSSETTESTTTTTAEPTTTTTTTTTEPETSSTTEAAPAEGAAGEMASAAEEYFGLLQRGRLDEAWQRTTPRFQNAQDRGAWEAFWGGFDRIRIVGDLAADPDSGSVVVPLDLDGQREDYTLDLRRQGGDWLVDGPVGNPTGAGDDD